MKIFQITVCSFHLYELCYHNDTLAVLQDAWFMKYFVLPCCALLCCELYLCFSSSFILLWYMLVLLWGTSLISVLSVRYYDMLCPCYKVVAVQWALVLLWGTVANNYGFITFACALLLTLFWFASYSYVLKLFA